MKKHRRHKNRNKALARRPKQPSLMRGGVPVRFNTTEPALQYLLDSTLLGELAMHWSADWLAGLFCITDFPPEWVALVRASIRGGWHEAVYAGGNAGIFSSQELWDSAGRWNGSVTVVSDAAPSQTPTAAKQSPDESNASPPPAHLALPDRDSSTL
jgi:hypothetical protein